MFVHLGGDVVVDVRRVVAILDARRLQRTMEARGLLERALRGGPSGQVTRAVIVTIEGVFPSPISPETVVKRIKNVRRLRTR